MAKSVKLLTMNYYIKRTKRTEFYVTLKQYRMEADIAK